MIVAVGSKVSRVRIGQKVACGANSPCNDCHFCLKGELLLCENMTVHGVRGMYNSSETFKLQHR